MGRPEDHSNGQNRRRPESAASAANLVTCCLHVCTRVWRCTPRCIADVYEKKDVATEANAIVVAACTHAYILLNEQGH